MTRYVVSILILVSLAAALAGARTSASRRALMQGKVKTAHTIHLDAVIDAPPEKVFELWTTPEGVKQFFAPDARIEAREGGAYNIIFLPSKDPEGFSHGTNGARILKFVPGKELAFEWITFAADANLGANAPPVAPLVQRNEKPLPTWVELRFEPIAGQPGKTRLQFAHYGFRSGELWDQSYAWFTRAWAGVLKSLGDSVKRK